MLTALDGWLRLLHPICPFITETLFQELHGPDARLVTDDWAQRYSTDAQAVSRMNRVMEVVNAIRSVRGEMNVNPGKRIEAIIACGPEVQADLLAEEKLLMSLAKLESLAWQDADTEVDGAAVAPLVGAKVYLPLAGLINVDEETARLNKNITKLDKDIAMNEGKLSNPKFCGSAPEAVVAKVRSDLDEAKAKREEMVAGVKRLGSL